MERSPQYSLLLPVRYERGVRARDGGGHHRGELCTRLAVKSNRVWGGRGLLSARSSGGGKGYVVWVRVSRVGRLGL